MQIAVLVLIVAACSREYAPGERFHYSAGNRYHVPGDVAVDFVSRGLAVVVKVESHTIDTGEEVFDDDVAALEARLVAAIPPVVDGDVDAPTQEV